MFQLTLGWMLEVRLQASVTHALFIITFIFIGHFWFVWDHYLATAAAADVTWLPAAGLLGVVTHRIGHSTLWYDATMTGYIQGAWTIGGSAFQWIWSHPNLLSRLRKFIPRSYWGSLLHWNFEYFENNNIDKRASDKQGVLGHYYF